MSTPGLQVDNLKELTTNNGVKIYNTTFSNTGTLSISGLTANTILYSNGSKNISSGSVSSNLTLTTGTLDTVQGIQTSSSPTFTGLGLTGTLTVDTINEKTSTAGVTVEGVLIKDSGITLINAVNEFSTDTTLGGNSDSAIPTEKAVKTYIDARINGISWKSPVRAATTGNIDLTTGTALLIDNYQTVAEDRVLVWKQTLPKQNGIYIVKSGAWVRSDDADTAAKFVNLTVFVMMGDTYADYDFTCTNNPGFTLDTDPITIIQRSTSQSHNALSSLQGGTTNEYYHLTSAQHTKTGLLLTEITSISGGTILFNGSILDVGVGEVWTNSITTRGLTFNVYGSATDPSLNCSTIFTTGGAGTSSIELSGTILVGNMSGSNALVYSDTNKKLQNVTLGNSFGSFSGTLNTIQDIRTTASPTFASPAFTGTLTVDTINEYTSTAGTTINGITIKSSGNINVASGSYAFKVGGTTYVTLSSTGIDTNTGTFSSSILTDVISEKTSTNGVVIDGTKIKDNTLYLTSTDTDNKITNSSGNTVLYVADTKTFDIMINGVLIARFTQ